MIRSLICPATFQAVQRTSTSVQVCIYRHIRSKKTHLSLLFCALGGPAIETKKYYYNNLKAQDNEYQSREIVNIQVTVQLCKITSKHEGFC